MKRKRKQTSLTNMIVYWTVFIIAVVAMTSPIWLVVGYTCIWGEISPAHYVTLESLKTQDKRLDTAIQEALDDGKVPWSECRDIHDLHTEIMSEKSIKRLQGRLD
jgi:hypothetical protein